MRRTTPDPSGGRTNGISEKSDEMLIEGVAAGEHDALSALYDRYQGLMYGMATKITRDGSLAQDVVQDAFVGIWKNAARYSSERASARTWILSITHHRAVDIVRRRRPTSELPEVEGPARTPDQLVLGDIWPEVAERLDATTVRGALESLPAAQRQAIELAYFGGLTQQEIASRTETPLGTVKSRVRLGLLQMRRVLSGGLAEIDRPSGIDLRPGSPGLSGTSELER
ncbi:MAG: sigma-70 family RNA polymerase sigma factor [Chloroflexota bacterium]|nr:sigma-70 family RNA polymerase sigma factor [Chloroflexota bacterium]